MTSSATTPTVRGWRRALLLAAGLAAVGLTAACADDGDGNVTLDVDGTQVGIDRDALLGELSEVRDLFAERSALPADVIADVDYGDGTLDVTLAEDTEGVAQAEQICNDLAEAIQLPDLAINVAGPDGTALASCEFGQ